MNLSAVTRFDVTSEVVELTDDALRRAGAESLEVFVLWSGTVQGSVMHCRSAHVPAQHSYQLDTGLLVRVEAEALHRLNVWLYEHSERLAVQVHAHPTHAFHSDTDDTYPIVTTLGGLSLVAADFGRWGILGKGTAGYRLDESGWNELTGEKIHDLVRIVA